MWRPRARREEGVMGDERIETTSRCRDVKPPTALVTAAIAFGIA